MGKTPALEASSSSRGVGKSGISGFGIFSKQGWKLGYNGKLQEIPLGYSSLHLLQPTPIPKIGADPLENLWIPMSRTFQGISQSLILYTLKFPQFSFFSPQKTREKRHRSWESCSSSRPRRRIPGREMLNPRFFSRRKSFPVGSCGIPTGFSKGKSGTLGIPSVLLRYLRAFPEFSKGSDSLPAAGNSTWKSGMEPRPR